MDLTPHLYTLRTLTRTDPDPRMRHRADSLFLAPLFLPSLVGWGLVVCWESNAGP